MNILLIFGDSISVRYLFLACPSIIIFVHTILHLLKIEIHSCLNMICGWFHMSIYKLGSQLRSIKHTFKDSHLLLQIMTPPSPPRPPTTTTLPPSSTPPAPATLKGSASPKYYNNGHAFSLTSWPAISCPEGHVFGLLASFFYIMIISRLVGSEFCICCLHKYNMGCFPTICCIWDVYFSCLLDQSTFLMKAPHKIFLKF